MANGDYANLVSAQDITNTTGNATDLAWLTAHKPDVDSATDDEFTPYINAIPYLSGATQNLIAYATYKLAALWFADNKDFTSAKYWDGEADKKKDKIVAAAKANPGVNTRTASAVFPSDPRNAKTPLPTQSSIFAFDNWA